jgi:TonB family protein
MACRSPLPFFAPLVGAFLIGVSLVALLAASTRVFPSSESEQPDPVAANSVHFSVHAKSSSTHQESAELRTPKALRSSQPTSPVYVASIAQQSHSLEEVIREFDGERAPVTHQRPSTNQPSPVTRHGEAQRGNSYGQKRNTGSESEPGPRPTIASSASKRPGSPLKSPSPQPDATSYGATVRALLARQPRAVGPAGTATVMFAIDRSGRLQYARISDKSYNSALDAMALATVENAAPFPPPPEALSPEALSYSIQIGFRER